MKICPMCKAAAFDDAQVCYGCLHRFTEDQTKASQMFDALSSSEDNLSCEELDEPRLETLATIPLASKVSSEPKETHGAHANASGGGRRGAHAKHASAAAHRVPLSSKLVHLGENEVLCEDGSATLVIHLQLHPQTALALAGS